MERHARKLAAIQQQLKAVSTLCAAPAEPEVGTYPPTPAHALLSELRRLVAGHARELDRVLPPAGSRAPAADARAASAPPLVIVAPARVLKGSHGLSRPVSARATRCCCLPTALTPMRHRHVSSHPMLCARAPLTWQRARSSSVGRAGCLARAGGNR